MHKRLSASSVAIRLRSRPIAKSTISASRSARPMRSKTKRKLRRCPGKVSESEKQLGPEYAALVNGLKEVDPNSPEGDEISSILENTRRLLSGLTAIVQAPKKAEIRAPGGIANRGPKSASKNRLRSKRKTLQPSSISRPPRLTRCLPPLRLN